MKQLSFFEILKRNFIAFCVVAAPLNSFSANGPQNTAESLDEARGEYLVEAGPHFNSEPAEVIEFRPEMPPALLQQDSLNLGKNTYSYQTVTFHPESPDQFVNAMDWIVGQMDNAQVKKITYQFYDLQAPTAQAKELTAILNELIPARHEQHFITVPVIEEEPLPRGSLIPLVAATLIEKTKQAARALPNKISQKVRSPLRNAALRIAKSEYAWRVTLSVTRFLVNGRSTSMSFMKATGGDALASYIVGYGVMGLLSGVLQFGGEKFNEFLIGRDFITEKYEKRTVERAERKKAQPLSDQELLSISARVADKSFKFKWRGTEAAFIAIPTLIMASLGYNLLDNQMLNDFLMTYIGPAAEWLHNQVSSTAITASNMATLGAATGVLTAIGSVWASWRASIYAQESWDGWNAIRKHLDVLKAHTNEEKLLAVFAEGVRMFVISAISVASLGAAMNNDLSIKIPGIVALILVGVTGQRFKKHVDKEFLKCEERLTSKKEVNQFEYLDKTGS